MDESLIIRSKDVIELSRKMKNGLELTEEEEELQKILSKLSFNYYDSGDLTSPL